MVAITRKSQASRLLMAGLITLLVALSMSLTAQRADAVGTQGCSAVPSKPAGVFTGGRASARATVACHGPAYVYVKFALYEKDLNPDDKLSVSGWQGVRPGTGYYRFKGNGMVEFTGPSARSSISVLSMLPASS